MNIIFLFQIIIFEILLQLSTSEEISQKRYISIPFTIEIPDSKYITNSLTFLLNYFSKRIFFNFTIGNNSQMVNGIFNQKDSCFEFLDKTEFYSFENINFYSPKRSNSFDIRKEIIFNTYSPNEYMAIGSDYFLFDSINKKNISFLFLKTENEEEINFSQIKDKQYLPKIGFEVLNQDSGNREKCPQFFHDIKKSANLSKYLMSFEFTDINKGNFIFGDEIYNYNKKKYHESQYVGQYSSANHQIYFNKVNCIFKNNENINISNGTYAEFDYNSGLIIGTSKFQNKINETFFETLIKDNICKIDLIKYNNEQYYVYNCNEKYFKNKIESFPKIIFASSGYEYNFELNFNDIFLKVEYTYYFLIIFKENYSTNTWIFGQPFYKKYNFTIKLDEYWIGFYNPNKPIIEDDENKNPEKNNKKKVRNIIIVIALSIFVIGLSIGMFLLGRKMKNERKKRANELTDDNYDYSVGINA